MKDLPADVHLQGVTKTYGTKTVLDRLDLTIGQGELLALLGPSGCGKTTSLRVLAGLERQDAGQVLIGGEDVSALDVRRRNIGIVFQSYSLFPHMSALENVSYGLSLRRVDKAAQRQRAGELLEMVGLAEHRHQYPQQMSGGQQQRVALARALAIEPRVLLLDEPLSALDAKVRVHLRDEIRRIQTQAGITTLLVTHDQEEALTMADRVGVMMAGRIEQLDTPQKLYSSPETPFISQFVGVVNRIPGTVRGGRIDVRIKSLTVANRDPVAEGHYDALIRPEDLTIQAADRSYGAVVNHVLRGPTTSLLVTVPELPELVRVDVASPTAALFPRGAGIRLGIDRDDTVVAPRQPAAGPAVGGTAVTTPSEVML